VSNRCRPTTVIHRSETVPDPRYAAFAARVRARERVLGYWVTLDSPMSTERIARIGL
jgi:hypothetical protein